MFKQYIHRAVERSHLAPDEAREAMRIVLSGDASPAQLAAWLIALRQKGETVEELAGFARAMRDAMVRINGVPDHAVDTCGTGGDGLGTFNISTAAGLLAAAAGATVAKHGNRAVSSSCGSADVLTALGFNIDCAPEIAERALVQTGFAFLFAPRFHPAMKHAAAPRREIGVRTVFNLLGPICNPAVVKRQVIGVYDRAWQRPLAESLRDLGAERVLVVTGPDNADELLPTGANCVTELDRGDIREFELIPEDVGVRSTTLDQLLGTDAAGNAEIIRQVAAGRGGAAAEAVIMNAGAALWAAGKATSLADGCTMCRAAIAKGRMTELIETASAASRGEAT
ncbi:MAG: anthranilate phosphoribosyltransferase [Candidatus Zixiibacteriota bacterium]